MTTALAFLDKDPVPQRQAEFLRVAEELSVDLDCVAYPAHTGQRLIELADHYQTRSVDHLIYVMHGYTTRLMSSRAGIHRYLHAPPAVVSLESWAEAWVPVLADDCRITLAACMCSRSPTATIRKRIGRAFGNWDPLVHMDGGGDSFAGLMRDALVARGIRPTIRGHTTPAHVLHNPACREHRPHLGGIGHSLFGLALGELGVEPGWRTCARFNGLVKGELAASWLLFEPGAVEAIRASWVCSRVHRGEP